MIQLANSLDCTGCSACANICNHNAITMVADEEGFLQPKINQERCIECSLCVKACPILHSNVQEVELKKQVAYALISHQDRKVSSSGGAFSVFSRWILEQGGIVYGATIDENLQVYHVGIDKLEDLGKLRGSKYVQSKIGNTYREAKDWLRKGRKVLFTGTPCQIAGLYGFFNGKKYEGFLYTLDLVCHGVPSQKVFDAYLDKIKKSCPGTGGNIEAFRFRKFDSWSIIPAIKFTESEWKILKYADNAYMNAFFEGLTFRESCFRCNYCNTDRVGTFTIADFWGIGKHGHKFKRNVACGVSLVIDNYGIMPQLVENLNQYAYIEKRWMDEAVAEQTNLKHPMSRNEMRDNIVKDMIDPTISLKDFSKKYGLPYQKTIKSVLKEGVKTLIYNLGLYNVYKTLSYKFS